jgi:hypothetical protein
VESFSAEGSPVVRFLGGTRETIRLHQWQVKGAAGNLSSRYRLSNQIRDLSCKVNVMSVLERHTYVVIFQFRYKPKHRSLRRFFFPSRSRLKWCHYNSVYNLCPCTGYFFFS